MPTLLPALYDRCSDLLSNCSGQDSHGHRQLDPPCVSLGLPVVSEIACRCAQPGDRRDHSGNVLTGAESHTRQCRSSVMTRMSCAAQCNSLVHTAKSGGPAHACMTRLLVHQRRQILPDRGTRHVTAAQRYNLEFAIGAPLPRLHLLCTSAHSQRPPACSCVLHAAD